MHKCYTYQVVRVAPPEKCPHVSLWSVLPRFQPLATVGQMSVSVVSSFLESHINGLFPVWMTINKASLNTHAHFSCVHQFLPHLVKYLLLLSTSTLWHVSTKCILFFNSWVIFHLLSVLKLIFSPVDRYLGSSQFELLQKQL